MGRWGVVTVVHLVELSCQSPSELIALLPPSEMAVHHLHSDMSDLGFDRVIVTRVYLFLHHECCCCWLKGHVIYSLVQLYLALCRAGYLLQIFMALLNRCPRYTE